MKYIPIITEFLFLLACTGAVEQDKMSINACLWYCAISMIASYICYRILNGEVEHE